MCKGAAVVGYCSKCGNKIDEGEDYCPECGQPAKPRKTAAGDDQATRIRRKKIPETDPQMKEGGLLIGIGIIIAIVISILIGIVIVLVGAVTYLTAPSDQIEKAERIEEKAAPAKIDMEHTPKAFVKKCIKCGENIPIASEECQYCGEQQKPRKK